MKKLLLFFALILPVAAQHSATLNWSWSQSSGDPAQGFKIYRSSTSGDCTVQPVKSTCQLLSTINSTNILTYIDTNVIAGQVYFYAATAYNTGGESVPSNEASCTIPFSAPMGKITLSGVSK